MIMMYACMIPKVLKQSLLEVTEMKYVPGTPFPEDQEQREGITTAHYCSDTCTVPLPNDGHIEVSHFIHCRCYALLRCSLS